MNNQISLPSDRRATIPAATQATAVEQARAVAEVAAAVKVAQDFPRDMTRAIERMRLACSQRSLADRAFYSLPRAGGRVEGSTVHLARELASCYGNLDYGIRELRRDDEAGESEMQAWAWDQENNVRSSRSFVVPHARMKNKRREALTDLADVANNNNSVAARSVRETIFTVLPVWFVAEAEEIAARTLRGESDGKPLQQQVADSAAYFRDTFGVTVEQLEKRIDRKRGDWTPQDLAVLRVLASELGRGEKRVEEEFPRERQSLSAADVTPPPADAPATDDGGAPWPTEVQS